MKFIDLFAGIGGFRLGMETAGHQCVFSSEIDKYAQKTYYANFGEMPSGDITKIKVENIPQHEILCAGFPCQAFSIAGKGLGFKDPRGTLFWEILRIIDFHKTPILFLENVPRLLTHNTGNSWAIIKQELISRGYTISHIILNAAQFGVPQSRKRLFIIARLDGIIFTFPTPPNISTVVSDILESIVNIKYFLTKKALKGIRKHNVKHKLKGNGFGAKIITPDKIAGTISARYYKGGETLIKPKKVANLNKGGQGSRVYSIKGTSITLSALGGGQGATTGLYQVETGIRRLTPRECARLQGFPDIFKIVVSDSQAYKQFGNSVCIKIIEAIAKNIRK